MPYDATQGQGRGVTDCLSVMMMEKVVKMADFKVCLLRWYACNQNTNGEVLVTLRQYLNFKWTDFLYLSWIGIT